MTQLLLLAVTTETDDGVAIPWIVCVVPPPDELPVWLLPEPEDTPPLAVLPATELPPQPASNPNMTATQAPPEIIRDII